VHFTNLLTLIYTAMWSWHSSCQLQGSVLVAGWVRGAWEARHQRAWEGTDQGHYLSSSSSSAVRPSS